IGKTAGERSCANIHAHDLSDLFSAAVLHLCCFEFIGPCYMTTIVSPQASDRAQHLAVLAGLGQVDIAIIGGGASGLGVALDAALRGLSVVLLESHDFAKGTSSRATKLVHGGVRYLAQGNIALVRE